MSFKDPSTGIDFKKLLNMSPEEKEKARLEQQARRFKQEQDELAKYSMGTRHLYKAREWMPGILVEITSPGDGGYVHVRAIEHGHHREDRFVAKWELHDIPPRSNKPVTF
jgi:hypothetical protein